MRLALALAMSLVSSCGTDPKEPKENPTNCSVKELKDGVEFSCIDKDGKTTSGVVKNGPQGEKGPVGEPGKGLAVLATLECKGLIEGWLEGSSYQIDFSKHTFETGAVFLSASNKLIRGKEVINSRSGSAFYLKSSEENLVSDGQLDMKVVGMDLIVSSKGGVAAKIPCLEK